MEISDERFWSNIFMPFITGSYAYGEPTESSDIDVCMLFPGEDYNLLSKYLSEGGFAHPLPGYDYRVYYAYPRTPGFMTIFATNTMSARFTNPLSQTDKSINLILQSKPHVFLAWKMATEILKSKPKQSKEKNKQFFRENIDRLEIESIDCLLSLYEEMSVAFDIVSERVQGTNNGLPIFGSSCVGQLGYFSRKRLELEVDRDYAKKRIADKYVAQKEVTDIPF